MISITNKQRDELLKLGFQKIGDKYANGYKCDTFVKDLYQSVGIYPDFNLFPEFDVKDIYLSESIGYPCFLRHKIHGVGKRYSHVGIIYTDQKLLHYSRYFGLPNVREVFLTPFEEIFQKYNFAEIYPIKTLAP
jgi:hypothetical protein